MFWYGFTYICVTCYLNQNLYSQCDNLPRCDKQRLKKSRDIESNIELEFEFKITTLICKNMRFWAMNVMCAYMEISF